MEDLGEKLVIRVRSHEANVEGSLDDGEKLGGPRVGMGRVETMRSIVEAGNRDAESVQAWEHGSVDEGNVEANPIVCVSRLVEAGEEEVLWHG